MKKLLTKIVATILILALVFWYVVPSAFAGVTFDSGESMTRTATLPGTGAWTITGWVKKTTNTAGYQTIFSLNNVGAGEYTQILSQGTGDVINQYYTAGEGYNESASLVTMATDTWYFFAMSFDGSNLKIRYVNTGGSTIANTITTAKGVNGSYDRLNFANNEFGDVFIGNMVSMKIWTTALSDADILAERQYRNPQTNLANVWATYQTKSGALSTDSSGNGRNLTENGTLSYVADPVDILGDDPVSGTPSSKTTINGSKTIINGAKIIIQ